jgi:hypothetical protein
MLSVIEGDITKLNHSFGIIHVVNDSGVFNAGVAKAIAQEFPVAKQAYLAKTEYTLGNIQCVPVLNLDEDKRMGFIVNMISQHGYGNPKKTGKVYLDYQAFEKCISKVVYWWSGVMYKPFPLYAPYGMGAGYAGGDWEKILDILEYHLPELTLVKKI